ncbi:MAG: exonuclease SbcCD subunit D, partial [Armatimonadota bacterium]
MRVLHFSDTHLGAEIHGRRDAETGMHTQLKDFLRCMDFMVETAIDKDVDVVLFTGDAYHFRRPDPLPQREFIKRIISLSERNI